MSVELTDTTGEKTPKKGTSMDALYRKYSAALHRFLGRRVQRDEVADIVQETYCRVLKSEQVDRIRHPRAFLFQVAHHVVLNAAKHRRTVGEPAVDVEEIELVDEQPSAYRRLKAEQELEIVRAALTELPETCRQVFVMHRFDNRSYAEIAQELELSVSMIEKHVSHALSHLRKKLLRVAP